MLRCCFSAALLLLCLSNDRVVIVLISPIRSFYEQIPASAPPAFLREDARRYDPAEHSRGRLAPFRDVLLAFRAKAMSYEQIAATLTRDRLRTSPAGVGAFCRRFIAKTEILRERRRLQKGTPNRPAATAPSSLGLSAAALPAPAPLPPGRRGPRIARDNY